MNENNFNEEVNNQQNPIGQTTYPNVQSEPTQPHQNQYQGYQAQPQQNQYQGYQQQAEQNPYQGYQAQPQQNQYQGYQAQPEQNQYQGYQQGQNGNTNVQPNTQNPYASMYDNNYQTNNSTFSQVYTNNEIQKINPYPNLTKTEPTEGKKKRKSGKLLVAILLLIIIAMVVVLVMIKTNFLKKHSSNNGSGVDANVDVKVTEQKDSDKTKTTEVTADDAKTAATGFVTDVEKYATLSKSSLSTANKGYDKQVPIATEGNVTCTSNDGTTWTGTVAPGSESCDNFMDAAIAKSTNAAPDSAKIIINNQGKFQANSWLKYDKYYCSYNGTEIDNCSTEKLN